MSDKILQLKVSLNRASPPIWRRICIAYDSTFLDLHAAIQDAFGWEDEHLHGFAFETKKTKLPTLIGIPDEDSMETLPEKQELVKNWLAKEGKQCLYTYDYGDNWDHTVRLEKILPAEPGTSYPRCIAGKRACPPEDSGGMWGYEHKLQVLRDPKHEDYEGAKEWMGADFDPEAFNPEDIAFRPSSAHDMTRQGYTDEPPEDSEDAMMELDHAEDGIPYESIRYLRAAETSKELTEHIKFVLENAYNQRLIDIDEFHEASPLWYAVVAEKHLDKSLIAPTVRLLTSTTDDWDFLNEQAQHLICLLAEKYPKETAEETTRAIDADLQLGLHTPYLFLFDVFLVVDAKPYETWLLQTMAHPGNLWRAPMAHLLSDLRMQSAIPVLKNVIKTMRANQSRRPEAGFLGYDETKDIEQALAELEGTKKRQENPEPEYLRRNDWEEHYRRFEDRFSEDEDDGAGF